MGIRLWVLVDIILPPSDTSFLQIKACLLLSASHEVLIFFFFSRCKSCLSLLDFSIQSLRVEAEGGPNLLPSERHGGLTWERVIGRVPWKVWRKDCVGLPESLELAARDRPTSARYLGLQGCLPQDSPPQWLHLSILKAPPSPPFYSLSFSCSRPPLKLLPLLFPIIYS